MKLFGKERAFLTALVLTMAAVLITLGVLQYRWSQQVSEADEARLGDNLHSLVMDWHLDFFRQFSGIAVNLQVGPDAGAHDNWRDYLQRYSEWRLTASDPALIENILIWESSQSDPRLLRLNGDRRMVEVYAARQEIKPLLARLNTDASNLGRATHAWMSGGEPPPPPDRDLSEPGPDGPPQAVQAGDPMTGWQFEPTIPALVHPIVHHALPGDLETPENPQRVDWIVLVLSPKVIENQVFPDLSQRYFSGSGGLAYKVAVVSGGDAPRVIYSSDADFGVAQEDSADVTMSMFGPPPESTEGHLWQSLKNGKTVPGKDWHKFSAPMWFPIINIGDSHERWTLLLKHREGSLEALVAAARRRNLFLSFGVLTLLAVGMTMVVFASYRAQKLARLQVDFVATVSHELRTPLSVIASAAENIADGVVEGKPQMVQYGSVIKDQTRQLAQLVEQILLFAATQEGRNHYTFRVLRVSEVVDAALHNTAGLIQVAGFKLEREVDPDLPEVTGDLPALTQCLQNLIGNAVKYGGENRWIRVRARLGQGAKEVQISVEDRGLGIKTSELNEIFEPFYRSAAVTAAQIRGTGLGLPLAKSIAEAMGGRLTVVSKLEHGSTFTLHLPVMEQPAMKEQATVER
jgi:two-component system sensor histidine kinase SenX3